MCNFRHNESNILVGKVCMLGMPIHHPIGCRINSPVNIVLKEVLVNSKDLRFSLTLNNCAVLIVPIQFWSQIQEKGVLEI